MYLWGRDYQDVYVPIQIHKNRKHKERKRMFGQGSFSEHPSPQMILNGMTIYWSRNWPENATLIPYVVHVRNDFRATNVNQLDYPYAMCIPLPQLHWFCTRLIFHWFRTLCLSSAARHFISKAESALRQSFCCTYTDSIDSHTWPKFSYDLQQHVFVKPNYAQLLKSY